MQPILNINLTAIRKNYEILSQHSAPAACSAVVKHNCYGLGIEKVVPLLETEGCELFWVAHAFEGEQIRPLLPKKRQIAVFQGFDTTTLPLFKTHKLTPVLSTLKQVLLWKKNHLSLPRPIVQIESGLHRLGLSEPILEQLQTTAPELFEATSIVMSHLGCADLQSHSLNTTQLKQFKKVAALFPRAQKSLSASGGIFLGPSFNQDITRAGAALYGLHTTSFEKNIMKNVVSMYAPVLQVTSLPKGVSVGYSAEFVTPKNTRIATISIGYADGVSWQLKNKGHVFFEKEGSRAKAPIVGRISMDMITVDISDLPDIFVSEGDLAIIFDDQYTADDIAKDAHTIGYDILSHLGSRFQIKYVN